MEIGSRAEYRRSFKPAQFVWLKAKFSIKDEVPRHQQRPQGGIMQHSHYRHGMITCCIIEGFFNIPTHGNNA